MLCFPAAIIYHCDLTKEPLQPHTFREVTVKGFSPADYQTTQVQQHTRSSVCLWFDCICFMSVCFLQVFYPSKDGTQIPMFIVHKKGIKLDGSHPAFLYGYGGFNISITPSYRYNTNKTHTPHMHPTPVPVNICLSPFVFQRFTADLRQASGRSFSCGQHQRRWRIWRDVA